MTFSIPLQLVDGHPWGWGAHRAESTGEKCACGKPATLHFRDGDHSCGDCAREWCTVNFISLPTPVRPGQPSLFEVAA